MSAKVTSRFLEMLPLEYRQIRAEAKLDAETRNAQKEEAERIKRIEERQQNLLAAQNVASASQNLAKGKMGMVLVPRDCFIFELLAFFCLGALKHL